MFTMTRTTWTFHTAGKLLFGPHAIAELGENLQALKLNRVLVITDQTLVAAGVVQPALDSLRAAGIGHDVFDGGLPEPTLDVATRCAEHGRRYQPDGLLAIGGGSNMDLAKMVAILLTHGGEPRDYFGENRVPGPIMPLACVATTSGTGSEVTAGTVLTDTANHIKVGIMSNFLRPRLAVVDPCLTLTCPQKFTAHSGIDALVHAIEAYTAVDNAEFPLPANERSCYQGRHPLGEMFAEKAIRLVGEHLAKACDEPQNLSAREGMSLSSTLAGMAFSNVGVALVHAMEYPVGGAVHVSHGEGNGLLLPYVMRFNLPVRQAEFARIAEWLGADVRGLTVEQAALRAVEVVEQLRAKIGIRPRLRDLGVRQDQLAGFAEKAASIKRILRVNPRYPSQAEIEAIYHAAW